MRRMIISLLLCSFLPLLISGCTRGSFWGEGSPEQTVAAQSIESLEDAARFTVVMDDDFFGYSDSNMISPPVWTLPEGKQALFTFENVGTLEHDWVVVKPGVKIPIPFDVNKANDLFLLGLGRVPGQRTTQVTFTAPKPGTYLVMCTVSGHYPFMQGRLVVTEATR